MLTRSPALWGVALGLAAYGVYAVTRGVDAWQPIAFAFGAGALVAAAALVLERRWSEYLVHAIVVVLIGSWLLAVAILAAAGWPYRDGLDAVLALAPGITGVALCVAASATVFHHFRRAGRRGNTGARAEFREDRP